MRRLMKSHTPHRVFMRLSFHVTFGSFSRVAQNAVSSFSVRPSLCSSSALISCGGGVGGRDRTRSRILSSQSHCAERNAAPCASVAHQNGTVSLTVPSSSMRMFIRRAFLRTTVTGTPLMTFAPLLTVFIAAVSCTSALHMFHGAQLYH